MQTLNKSPLVSVIINCYNSEDYLRAAIDSVYAQGYGNWEIIIWDNASTDATAMIATSYDDRLRYYCGEANVPLGEARNLALGQARGDLLAFLDSDDMWEPDKLEKQVPKFTDIKVGLSYSNALYFGQGGRSFVLYDRVMPEGNIFSSLLRNYFLCISSVIVRRSALGQMTECFDSRFEMIEEMDLFCRIAHDWECVYVHDVTTKYRVHSKSDTWKKFYKISLEYKLFLEKCTAMYPCFEDIYASELVQYRRITFYYFAVGRLLEGDPSSVRKSIRFDCLDVRTIMLLIASFLPKGLFLFLFCKRKML